MVNLAWEDGKFGPNCLCPVPFLVVGGGGIVGVVDDVVDVDVACLIYEERGVIFFCPFKNTIRMS